MKVKTRFILLLLAFTYVTLFIVAIVAYLVGTRIINDQVHIQLELAAQNVNNSVNKLINDRFTDLQLLISDSVLSSNAVSAEEKTEVLRNSLVNLGWYDQLYLADTEGKVISASRSSAIGETVAEEPWYIKTKKDFINVSNVTTLPFTDEEKLIFSNTIHDQSDKVIGTIFAEFSLEVIKDLIKDVREEEKIYIATNDGSIIVQRSTDDKVFENLLDLRKDQSREANIEYEIKSEGYLNFRGNDWTIIMQVERAIAYAPLNQFIYYIFAIVVILSLMAIAGGRIAGNKFTKPVNILTDGLKHIQRGKLDYKIVVKTGDEFGLFAENFNQMADSIKRKTQNILEEKGKYESILESVDEGIILFDTNSDAIAYNNRFKQMFNYDDTKLKPEDVMSFFYDKKNKINKTDFEEIKHTIENSNDPTTLRKEITLESPSYEILNIFSTIVKTANGQLLGRIWSFEDITETREAEQSKNEFVLVASHKLRTPLTAINWAAQFCSENQDKLSDEQKEAVKVLIESEKKLTTIVQALLTVAEVKKNTINLQLQSVPLDEYLSNINDKLFPKFGLDRKYKLKLPPAADMEGIKIKVDKEKMQHLVAGIVENAYIYSKEDKTNNIAIKLNKEEDKVVISVEDNGIGMDEPEKNQVFSKFFRSEDAIHAYTDGLGLHLFLSKIIAESAGQKIWFESSKDKGSKFYISFGLAKK